MHDVAIVGAGELGGALADLLARRDLVSAIRLVDETGSVAAGKALDILQSAPIHGFATSVTGATDLAAVAHASIFLIADCATRGEWQGDEGLMLLKRLPVGRKGIVICAGASQRDLVERGARELGFARTRLFGSSPEALASAIRAIVALETDGSAHDVALTVLGVPPSQIVVPWEDATIGGIAATRLLDDPTRRRIVSRVPALWPPGPHALATAAVRAIEAVVGRSRGIVCCVVAPDDAMGRRTRAAAMPARLGPEGITAVEIPPLTSHDRVALDNAILL